MKQILIEPAAVGGGSCPGVGKSGLLKGGRKRECEGECVCVACGLLSFGTRKNITYTHGGAWRH